MTEAAKRLHRLLRLAGENPSIYNGRMRARLPPHIYQIIFKEGSPLDPHMFGLCATSYCTYHVTETAQHTYVKLEIINIKNKFLE